MHRVHLPIADPCHEDWDAMHAVERGRFCQSCEKQVFDLSSMTEDEARDVLHEHAGRNICVRYCHDTTGNISFRPAKPVRVAALAMAMAACTPHERAQEREQVVGELVDTPHDVVERVSDPSIVGASPDDASNEGESEALAEPRMGEAVAPEPPEVFVMGEPAAVTQTPPSKVVPRMGRPAPSKHIIERKGDVAVPNEPCDAPTAPKQDG